MKLEDAVNGMLDAREKLRSKEGINNPMYMSEHMDRLAQYTGAVEEHLADLEEKYEKERYSRYLEYSKTLSATAADNKSKAEVHHEYAQRVKLTRLVSSSWRIVSEKQSRFNHLSSEIVGQ